MNKYTGSQIGITEVGMSANDSQNIIDLYPVGSKVYVYFMPNKPRSAMLDPNYDPGGGKIILVISSVFMAIGVSILLFKTVS